jgi:hypothetical protein
MASSAEETSIPVPTTITGEAVGNADMDRHNRQNECIRAHNDHDDGDDSDEQKHPMRRQHHELGRTDDDDDGPMGKENGDKVKHDGNHEAVVVNHEAVVVRDAAVSAVEATNPVVDAACLATISDDDTSRSERLEKAEQHTVDADAGWLAAKRGLLGLHCHGESNDDPHRRQCPQNLSKIQWAGVTIVCLVLLALLAAATCIFRCGSGHSRPNAEATAQPAVPTNTATTTTFLSPRAQFIVEYVNNITLRGQTIRYPDDTTPEGRALKWLVDSEHDEDNSGPVAMKRREKPTKADKVSLRQRYALATLWFQTPDHFDHPRLPDTRFEDTWGTTLDECDWLGVTCRNATFGLVNKLQLNGSVRGGIPNDLALLTDLTSLGLSLSDQLVGTIPFTLGALTALEFLSFFDNSLSGTVPSQFGAMTALELLWLSSNALTGTIPSQLGAMTALSSLDLSYNVLTGTIPSQLGTMTALMELALPSNALTGTIPPQLGAQTALEILRLSSNELTGTIPSQLGALSDLMELGLSDNTLNGTVPAQLGSLTALIRLTLYNNALNGSLTFCSSNDNHSENDDEDLNQNTFEELAADCDKVTCPCCTHCCPSGGWDSISAIPPNTPVQCVDG